MKTKLFFKLIRILDEADIRYAIVGNTDAYPDHIGSDVDIMVPPAEVNRVQSVLWRIEDKDTKVVQLLQHETVAFYYVVVRMSENGIVTIQPDICTDYYRNGIKLLSAEEMLNDTLYASDALGRMKGFKVLSPPKEFLYYIIKKIDKINLSEDQFAHIRGQYLKDPIGCRKRLSSLWKAGYVDVICSAVENNDKKWLSDNLKILRRELHRRVRILARDYFSVFLLKLKRCLHATGFTVCLCGLPQDREMLISQLLRDFDKVCRRQKVMRVANLSFFTALKCKVVTIYPKIRSTLVVYSVERPSSLGVRVVAPDVIIEVGSSHLGNAYPEGNLLQLSSDWNLTQRRFNVNEFIVCAMSSKARRRYMLGEGC